MSAKPQTMSTRARIMLVGEQSTRIDVHGARENGARLALLWGTLLLTFKSSLRSTVSVREAPTGGGRCIFARTGSRFSP